MNYGTRVSGIISFKSFMVLLISVVSADVSFIKV